MKKSLLRITFISFLIFSSVSFAQDPMDSHSSFWDSGDAKNIGAFFHQVQEGFVISGTLSQFAGIGGTPEQRVMKYMSVSAPNISAEKWQAIGESTDHNFAGHGSGFSYVGSGGELNGLWELNPRQGFLRLQKEVSVEKIGFEQRSLLGNTIRFSHAHDLCLFPAHAEIQRDGIPSDLAKAIKDKGFEIAEWDGFALFEEGNGETIFYAIKYDGVQAGSWMCWRIAPNFIVEAKGVTLFWDSPEHNNLNRIEYHLGARENPDTSGVIEVDSLEFGSETSWAFGKWVEQENAPLVDKAGAIEKHGRWVRGAPLWREPTPETSWRLSWAKFLRGVGSLGVVLGLFLVVKVGISKRANG
jgi:hypothetical protein